MLVHGRERDDNFLDNFAFSNKAAFHNATVIRSNVHIWGAKRPTAVAGWQCHRRPKEAAECQRQKTPERRCLSFDATKAPESSCTLLT
jgi:hypothetical protein